MSANIQEKFSASNVMEGNMDPKDTDLVVVQDALAWIPDPSLETLRAHRKLPFSLKLFLQVLQCYK